MQRLFKCLGQMDPYCAVCSCRLAEWWFFCFRHVKETMFIAERWWNALQAEYGAFLNLTAAFDIYYEWRSERKGQTSCLCCSERQKKHVPCSDRMDEDPPMWLTHLGFHTQWLWHMRCGVRTTGIFLKWVWLWGEPLLRFMYYSNSFCLGRGVSILTPPKVKGINKYC